MKKKHTRVTFKIYPVGEKPYQHTETFEDFILKNKKSYEDYFDWGGDGNWIIENFVDNSPFGALKYWKISKIEKLSSSDLGIEWAMSLMNIKEQRRESQMNKECADIPRNFWLSPKGEVFECEWHVDWASNWIDDHIDRDRYLDFVKATRGDVYDFMQSLGWSRFQSRFGGNVYIGGELTRDKAWLAQKYCWKYGFDFTSCLVED